MKETEMVNQYSRTELLIGEEGMDRLVKRAWIG